MTPTNPLTLEERAARSEADLDRFEDECALPEAYPTECENEAKRLLALTPDELSKLTPEKCGEAAFTLGQYAFFLQRVCNRKRGKVRRSEAAIRRIIPPDLDQVTGYSLEERRMKAIRQNDAARAYEDIQVKAQLELERVSYLADMVRDMAGSLKSISQTKRGV